jgi:hypothetical protein
MENPLLDRIINGPPRAAGKSIRALKGPLILTATGVLIALICFGTILARYNHVYGSYPPIDFFSTGGILVLGPLLRHSIPQQVDSQVAYLKTVMTPEQIFLSRILFIGGAIGISSALAGVWWAKRRMFNAAKRRLHEAVATRIKR